MTKHKHTDEIVAAGLAYLMAERKFNLGDAAAITEAFAEVVAAVTRTKDLEERVRKLEQAEAARSKKAPIVRLREAG